MSRNILKSTLQNASFRIIFQILSRCITFILNAWVLRIVQPDVLGIMNVRLLLLESIIMLSRETFLKACQTNTKSLHWPQVINQIWLTVPICIVMCRMLYYVWTQYLPPVSPELTVQYEWACIAMALSCIIDQLCNCPLLIATTYCFVKLTIVLDALHILFRTAIFVAMLVSNSENALIAFASAQILSSIFYVIVMYGFFWWYIKEINVMRQKKLKDGKEPSLLEKKTIFSEMDDFQFTSVSDFFPLVMQNKDPMLNKNLIVLTFSFAKQCFFKQILTYGEIYVMTLFPILTFSEQAMYDVVNNLGSLAARFIFRPIEESGYFYFTQMIRRDEPIEKQDQKSVAESAQVLSQLCAVVTSIGLVALVFGQTYSHTLLYLYGGAALTNSPLPVTLLQWHCFAVLLLAINGVTECYAFATMNSEQLNRYNYLMVIFTFMFLTISYVFTSVFGLGPVGFILANCINMLARIIHSLDYIIKKHKNTNYHPLSSFNPKSMYAFLIVLGCSGIVTYLSQVYLYPTSIIYHILVGAVCFCVTVLTWAYQNRILLSTNLERYRRQSLVKSD